MKFGKRESVLQVEEGECFAPKFDENSLIPCVTQHAATKEILMFAYMNAEALDATLSTGLAHYWSRSRQKLWRKGETSGMTQRVHRALIDDDQDCLVIEVDLATPTAGGDESSCHVGYRSCFYREIEIGERSETRKLVFTETEKAFNPQDIYGDAPNPTKL
jgi:phosphoribosyl-AMP cyclohydrolase